MDYLFILFSVLLIIMTYCSDSFIDILFGPSSPEKRIKLKMLLEFLIFPILFILLLAAFVNLASAIGFSLGSLLRHFFDNPKWILFVNTVGDKIEIAYLTKLLKKNKVVIRSEDVKEFKLKNKHWLLARHPKLEIFYANDHLGFVIHDKNLVAEIEGKLIHPMPMSN